MGYTTPNEVIQKVNKDERDNFHEEHLIKLWLKLGKNWVQRLGQQAIQNPKLFKIYKTNLGCIRHSCNEYFAAIEMSIEVFYLCIFSRKRGWDGQGEVSKGKKDHWRFVHNWPFFFVLTL